MSGRDQLGAEAPLCLAECRREGRLAELPLHLLAGRAEAEAFQRAALAALGGETCGYKIGATGAEAQRLLGCNGPLQAPILRQHVLASGASLRLPPGCLGIECEVGFVLARDYPAEGERPDAAGLRASIAECFIGLEVIGRRVTAAVPLTEITGIADYGFNVAVVRGGSVADWQRRDLAAMPVQAAVDDAIAARGSGAEVLGHPLNALLWLAEDLRAQGRGLRRGEMVFTGTCTGITKVAPGQSFEGRFADLPPVRLRLEAEGRGGGR
ncbi:MAG TPA: fumarylacetoacetate hydrolase family protein [Stellaceae bacterium]|nr:fumarylacetoacetate hydrolase family protein [Stellaceae bacterium]